MSHDLKEYLDYTGERTIHTHDPHVWDERPLWITVLVTCTVLTIGLFTLYFMRWASGKSITGKSTIGMTAPPPKVLLKATERKKMDLKHGERLDTVFSKFEGEYQQDINNLCSDFEHGNEKQEYKRNFYKEMLTKLLIELDGIDLVSLPAEKKAPLKEKRKGFIKMIQADLKRLDTLH